MKKLLIVFLIILLFSIPTLSQEFDLNADNIDKETSIVLLNIFKNDELVKRDYFFEILVYEEENYLLVPINLLSNNTQLTIIYDRLSNIVKINNENNNKTVQIDLTNRTYIGFEQWNNEPPVILESDFFVSSKAISYLLDTDIEWKSRRQELVFRGEFEGQFEKESLEVEDKEKKIEEKKEEIITRESGPNLGSINYKVVVDYRNNSYYKDDLDIKEVVSIFSRYNNWALSLKEEASYDIYGNEADYDFPLIRAKYKDGNKLIVLGDTSFEFQNTIGKKNIRGLFIRIPENLSLKVVPTIDLTGEVEPNSIVELFVNNELIKKVNVEDSGKYNFEKVALKFRVLNRINIVITKPNGETEVIDKKITAVEKLLNPGTKEFELVGGYYGKQSSDETYEGRLAGFRTNIALNKNFSFNTEAIYYDLVNENDEKYISSNVGLAYRLFDNTIATVDWYYGNYNGEDLNGYKFNLHYAFNRGYLDGLYFHIPTNLDEVIPMDSGERQQIAGVIALNENWTIEPVVGTYESLDVDNPLSTKYVQMKLNRDNNWVSHFAILGSYENINKVFYNNVGQNIYSYEEVNNKYGAGIEINRTFDSFRFNGEGNIYQNNIHIENITDYTYNDIDYSIELYKVFADKLAFKVDYETSYEDYLGSISDKESEIELRARYNINNNSYLSLSGKDIVNQSSNIDERRYSASLNTSITRNIRLYGQYSSINTSGFVNYDEFSLNAIYNIGSYNKYINLFTNYTIPQNDFSNETLQYGLSYNYIFDNFDQLVVEVGKNYLTQFDRNFEYYVTVSFAQAYSFAQDKILKSNYNSSTHRSFIAGYVYLDENNNGKYDKGEEKLPNIAMSLDNITSRSNEDGLYRFNPMMEDTYILDFDYNSLSADYTPVTEEKIIKIRENENISINFGLTLNGSISGKLFLDRNNNGAQDEGEEPLNWVGIILDDEKYDYTDDRGEFYFENVSLGVHTLDIVNESVPNALGYKEEFPIEITIKKGKLDISDILIPLNYNF